MYQEFYGFKEKPFALTPDPKFFYLAETQYTALESLLYGIQQRVGFMVVTGDIGTGKTTLCRVLLEKLDKKVKTAVIFNSFLTEGDLLKAILQDFGFPSKGRSKKERIDVLNHFLVEQLSQGENAVLIIDEAQNLSIPVLEQIRMLSNLETEKEKILQIILLGQSELNQKLRSSALRQLNQRIAIRHHLLPLSPANTEEYIYQRLSVAGADSKITFSQSALNSIYRFSRGTPRLINLLCDRALMACFVDQSLHINKEMVRKAKDSLRGQETGTALSPLWVLLRRSMLWPISLCMLFFPRLTRTLIPSQESYHFISEKIEDIYLQICGVPAPRISNMEAEKPPKDYLKVPAGGLF